VTHPDDIASALQASASLCIAFYCCQPGRRAVTNFTLRGTSIKGFPGKAEQSYCFAGSTYCIKLKSYQAIAVELGIHYNSQYEELTAIRSKPA